jgi:hypothetical protein
MPRFLHYIAAVFVLAVFTSSSRILPGRRKDGFPTVTALTPSSQVALAESLPTSATPVTDTQPSPTTTVDNTQPTGTNPIKLASVERLGYQLANNSCSHRDLGFTGKLGGNWYALFGDTLWCAPGVTDPEKDDSNFHGMVRDSVSLLTSDPLTVVDLNLNNDSPVQHQNQFVPYNTAWNETNTYGFGGTSLCETNNATGEGVIYYLVVRFSLLKPSQPARLPVLTFAHRTPSLPAAPSTISSAPASARSNSSTQSRP